MSRHKSGKKFSSSHTTLIDAAVPLVERLERCAYVDKIVLGPIKSLRSGPQRLKVTEIRNGVKIMVRGTASVQIVYIYTADIQSLKKVIALGMR